MQNDNLKEMMSVGSGSIAGMGINKDGSPYNAGGNPADTYGEPPVFVGKNVLKTNNTNVLKKNTTLLNRSTLLPNSKNKKPLRNILDPMTPIGKMWWILKNTMKEEYLILKPS